MRSLLDHLNHEESFKFWEWLLFGWLCGFIGWVGGGMPCGS